MTTFVLPRAEKKPVERSRLYMLLGWLNAVVNERLRYAPLGWTKRYEFSDADTQCAIECIDQWVDKSCPGAATHINPEELPWDALCATLSQSLYGGRIANAFDQAILDSFIRNIFRVENYGYNAVVAYDMNTIVNSGDGENITYIPVVTLPNGCGKDVVDDWIASLPDKNSPTWLGLPSTAENQLQSMMGHHVLSGLTVLKGVGGDASLSAVIPSSRGSTDATTKNKLLERVLKACALWLSMLPNSPVNRGLTHAHGNNTESTPVERFVSREGERGNAILARVRGDLEMVKDYCEGKMKSTNKIRYLFGCFSKGQLPEAWSACFDSPPGVSIGVWVTNLADRCASIGCNNHGCQVGSDSIAEPSYWLGGMFSPEAFITATRQLTAQVNKWSLEELELYLEIGIGDAEGVADTVVRNLVFECAQWSESDGITLSASLRSRLPISRLRWCRRTDSPPGNFITFPVYLDTTRANLVVEVLVEVSANVPPEIWAQRSVAIVLQSL